MDIFHLTMDTTMGPFELIPSDTSGHNHYTGSLNSSDLFFDLNGTSTNSSGTPNPNMKPMSPLSVETRIALYSIVFFLSIVGNTLVIVTLIQNRRMRTVTNVFLLNLSISDLLLAMFCMPFTLIPTLLQNFIFGATMCILIRYLQGVSVGVSVFTLVAISLERYFAICQPLRSRSWQTLSHSYKTLGGVWFLSFVLFIPVAVFQKLYNMTGTNKNKCVEIWPKNSHWEKLYTIVLDLVLLVGPLVMMLVAYGKISWTLWKGMRMEMKSVQEMSELRRGNEDDIDSEEDSSRYGNGNSSTNPFQRSSKRRQLDIRNALRQTNTERNLCAKRRVIKMLFAIVLEFFLCWTPTYVVQTWSVFDIETAYYYVSPVTMNFIHLISYISSCCNPITYCFMNKKFRQGFLHAFRCCRRKEKPPWRNTSDYYTSQRTELSASRTYANGALSKSTAV